MDSPRIIITPDSLFRAAAVYAARSRRCADRAQARRQARLYNPAAH